MEQQACCSYHLQGF